MRILWSTVFVLTIDQLTKVIVLQTMYRGQSIPLLGDWLKLTFTENPGMAFGITFGPKGLVTVLSIIATGMIMYYMYRVRDEYLPYRASLAVILGGALGNIIDRVFYGLLFGYGPLFSGKVVDFIHVDIWRGFIPEAVPVVGGNYTALFPIWNVADMAIVCGVVGILLFQKRFHEGMEAHLRTEGKLSSAEAPRPAPPPHTFPPAAAVSSNGLNVAGESGEVPLPGHEEPAEAPQASDGERRADATGSAEPQKPE